MRICFFAHEKKENLQIFDYYAQDIRILKSLDPNLIIATKYYEIDFRVDLLFIWWWTYALFPVAISKIKGVKTIVTGTYNYRCPELNFDYYRRPFWQRFLIKMATNLTSLNILVSKKEYEAIKNDWKLKNIEYLPHCVDVNKYAPANKPSNDFLFTMCWTGKENVRRKCLFQMIDAVALLSNRYKDILLLIGGKEGDAAGLVKQYIIDNNLSNNVQFLGEISCDDKIRYMQNCACYLQPSKFEGYGLAIAEAMSCGAPIVTSLVGEVPILIGNLDISVSTSTDVSIANAVEKILSSDCSRLRQEVRERISEHFSYEIKKSKLSLIINELLK